MGITTRSLNNMLGFTRSGDFGPDDSGGDGDAPPRGDFVDHTPSPPPPFVPTNEADALAANWSLLAWDHDNGLKTYTDPHDSTNHVSFSVMPDAWAAAATGEGTGTTLKIKAGNADATSGGVSSTANGGRGPMVNVDHPRPAYLTDNVYIPDLPQPGFVRQDIAVPAEIAATNSAYMNATHEADVKSRAFYQPGGASRYRAGNISQTQVPDWQVVENNQWSMEDAAIKLNFSSFQAWLNHAQALGEFDHGLGDNKLGAFKALWRDLVTAGFRPREMFAPTGEGGETDNMLQMAYDADANGELAARQGSIAVTINPAERVDSPGSGAAPAPVAAKSSTGMIAVAGGVALVSGLLIALALRQKSG